MKLAEPSAISQSVRFPLSAQEPLLPLPLLVLGKGTRSGGGLRAAPALCGRPLRPLRLTPFSLPGGRRGSVWDDTQSLCPSLTPPPGCPVSPGLWPQTLLFSGTDQEPGAVAKVLSVPKARCPVQAPTRLWCTLPSAPSGVKRRSPPQRKHNSHKAAPLFRIKGDREQPSLPVSEPVGRPTKKVILKKCRQRMTFPLRCRASHGN